MKHQQSRVPTFVVEPGSRRVLAREPGRPSELVDERIERAVHAEPYLRLRYFCSPYHQVLEERIGRQVRQALLDRVGNHAARAGNRLTARLEHEREADGEAGVIRPEGFRGGHGDLLARCAVEDAGSAGPPCLDANAYNDSDVFTFPNGCHAAEIEINPETGTVALERYAAVDDYGRVINLLLTLGQVQGGLAQGIGQALFEHTVYEEGSGQLLSGSFMDYALPRADDLPPLNITVAGLPTAVNPLGVKGAGQAGCMAAPQAIINAILDALAPLGIGAIDMPATPERIWRAIRGARF